jgi:hypothetical protein
MLCEEWPISCAAELFPGKGAAWAFTQMVGYTAGNDLSSYWDLKFPSGGNFLEAAKLFTEERQRHAGGAPTKVASPAELAAHEARVAEAEKIRRERL